MSAGRLQIVRAARLAPQWVTGADVMKSSMVALCLALGAASSWAQDRAAVIHEQTSPVPGARFEVLQSTIAARWTFRLDRYTGRIWQLVKTKEDDNAWEEMPVAGLPQVAATARPRFQLFASGLAARHTFLLDTDTGRTWVVVRGTRRGADGAESEYFAWERFKE